MRYMITEKVGGMEAVFEGFGFGDLKNIADYCGFEEGETYDVAEVCRRLAEYSLEGDYLFISTIEEDGILYLIAQDEDDTSVGDMRFAMKDRNLDDSECDRIEEELDNILLGGEDGELD